MTAFWFWVIVAIAFAVVEVMTVAFFAVFITIGALGAAVVSLLGFGLLVQAIVLGVLGVAGIMIARPFLVERLHIGRPTLRSGADSMVGQQAILLEPIGGVGQPGHIKIAGELWPALTDISEQHAHNGIKLSPEDWRLVFLDAFWRMKGEELRLVPNLDGNGFVPLSGRSTSDLSVPEMSEYLELIKATGAGWGVVFNDGAEDGAVANNAAPRAA